MQTKNFILEIDNFLTNSECDEFVNNYGTKTLVSEDAWSGYEKYDLNEQDKIYQIILQRLPVVLNYYKQIYSEINHTGSHWALTHLRFKKFNPGKNYDVWHSEHSLRSPNRILNILLYLSDHNCGTQFYNGNVIKSKKGKLLIFPSYFTHTHKGQKCPENKTRYLLSGYFNFVDINR